MLLFIAMFITIIHTLSRKLTCHVGKSWSIDRWIKRQFGSIRLQVKCAWEHGLCTNVCILDHDVTKYKPEYDLVKVPTWNFPQKSGPWKVPETTVKNLWKGREKTVKSHQKLAPKFYSFVWVFCSLFTGFSLKSLEPLVISSSLGTYRLEIGWCAAVVAEAVACMWGLAGFPLYMLTIYHISQDSQDQHDHYVNLYK